VASGYRKRSLIRWRGHCDSIFLCCVSDSTFSEQNIIAMRLGPGKHLQGRVLLGGVVKPEEFDYFHEVCSFTRSVEMTCVLWLSNPANNSLGIITRKQPRVHGWPARGLRYRRTPNTELWLSRVVRESGSRCMTSPISRDCR
jgi:hypothetical protein